MQIGIIIHPYIIFFSRKKGICLPQGCSFKISSRAETDIFCQNLALQLSCHCQSQVKLYKSKNSQSRKISDLKAVPLPFYQFSLYENIFVTTQGLTPAHYSPPKNTANLHGSEVLSMLRISEFFQFIQQTFGRLFESIGKMGQIDQI